MCEATLCKSPTRFLVIAMGRNGRRTCVQAEVCGQHLNSYVREFCKSPQGVTVLPTYLGSKPS